MSHVGKHMQEISHAAIPMSAMANNDGGIELSDEDNSFHTSIASAQIAEPEPYFIVPPGLRSSSIFVGRGREIKQLEKLLIDERLHDWGGPVSVLLHGMPGVGKTHIAREFTYKNREKFKGGVFWIAAQSKELMMHDLENMAQKLGIWDGSGDPIQSINVRLGEHRNWLLVFDGLPSEEIGGIVELSKVAPDGKNSSIIYVARSSNVLTLHWPTVFKIEPLTKEASKRLLFWELNIADASEREKTKATELIESVGGLPLAICALARRLTETKQPLEKYESSMSHLNLAPTYQTILDNLLRAGHIEAWNMLHIMCWYAPSIPVKMLLFGLKDLNDINVKASEREQVPNTKTTFAQLTRYALIERNEPDDSMDEDSDIESRTSPEPIDTIAIHTVIQNFCCDSLHASNLVTEWLARAIHVFCCSILRANQNSSRACDYVHYVTHGRKLLQHCLNYRTKDRFLGHLKGRLEPFVVSIEQEMERRHLSAKAQPVTNSQPSRALISNSTSQNDRGSQYNESTSEESMIDIEAKVSPEERHSDT